MLKQHGEANLGAFTRNIRVVLNMIAVVWETTEEMDTI